MIRRLFSWVKRLFKRERRGGARPGAGRKPAKVKSWIRADHPLVRVIEEHVRDRSNKHFKWPTVELMRAAREHDYNPSSMSPLLSDLVKRGVVRRIAKGRFEWIGFPAPRMVAATDVPAHLAEKVLHIIKSAVDGATHGQIVAAFPGVPLHTIDGTLGALSSRHKIVKVSSRFYAWSDLERRTSPGGGAA